MKIKIPRLLIVVTGGILLVAAALGLKTDWFRPSIATHSLLGLQTAYSVSLSAEANLSLGIGPSIIKEKLHGDLLSTVTSADIQGKDIFFQFPAPYVEVNADGTANLSQGQSMKVGLAQGFFAHYGANGELVTVTSAKAFDGMTEAMAHTIASLMQVTRQPGSLPAAESRDWFSIETDGSGTYQAHYRFSKTQAEVVIFNKQIVKYAFTRTDPRVTILPNPSGSLDISLSKPDSALRAIQGELRIDLNYTGGGSGGFEKTSIDLSWKNEKKISDARLAELNGLRVLPGMFAAPQRPNESARMAEQNEEIQRRELNGKTVADLRSDLMAMNSAKNVSEKSQRKLFLQLRALLLLKPEQASEIAKTASSLNKDGSAFGVLVSALAGTETPEAQTGLREVIETVRDDSRLAASLIPNLSMVNHPTPETEEFLRKLVLSTDDDIRDSAKLGLGMVAGRLSLQGDVSRSGAIVTLALGDLKNADNLEQQVLALKVLGNSGASQAFDTISGYLGDASPELRRQAANALRFIPGDQADAALIGTLSQDGDSAVRAQAAVSLGFRQPSITLLSVEERQFSIDPNMNVRKHLLRAINLARAQFPDDAGPFLQRVSSANDSDLSRFAQDLLDE